jgi:hypothetical protein
MTPQPPDSDPLIPAFAPVPVRRRKDGWTAERQTLFIETLAETGCIVEASDAVGMTPRSAYRLAARPDATAFAEAWDMALPVARRRLVAIARSYAVDGVPEQIWKDGVLVAERRRPSVRLLIYLLERLDPVRVGRQHAPEGDDEAARAAPRRRLDELLEWLEDVEDEPEQEAEQEQEQEPGEPPSRARRGETFCDLSRRSPPDE